MLYAMRYLFIILVAAAPALGLVMGASVGGGFASPVGDFTEIVGASAVVDGRAMFCINPNLSLTAGLAYRIKHEPKAIEGVAGTEYDIIPVLVGATYRLEYLPLMPYFGGGVAAAPCSCTVPTAEGSEKRDAVRLGAFAEGGTEYYLGDNFGVDVRGRFIATFGGEEKTYGDTLVDADNYMAFDAVLGVFFYP
jgi:hypothetical protein